MNGQHTIQGGTHHSAFREAIVKTVRDHFGKVVRINSGYRSVKLCLAVGSSAKSQHAKGEAADFEINGISNHDLAKWVYNNLNYDQLILEFYDPKGDPNSGAVPEPDKIITLRSKLL